ncbi:MAG: hypothetical protein HC834_04835 [Rhodospirillales bacterium]|nr:hypothetical protein [Rhodospirillales bacterium]
MSEEDADNIPNPFGDAFEDPKYNMVAVCCPLVRGDLCCGEPHGGRRNLFACAVGCDTRTELGREAAFRIEGDLSRESFLYGRPEKSSKKKFTIVIENCRWQIESSNEAEDFYSLKSFSDGVIHNVSRVPENLRKTSEAESPNGNKYHVVAEKHDVPRDDYSGISYLWLAYCSNCYFDALDGDRLQPVWMLDDALLREEGFTVRGLFSRPDGFLPSEVAYLHDGLMRIRSRGERKAFRAPAPFDRGFTNAVFKVLSATNLGGVSIPLEFEFLRFGLNQGEGGPQLNLRSRIVGTVNRVTSRVVPQDFVRALEGTAFVQDLRFARMPSQCPSCGIEPRMLFRCQRMTHG